MPPYMSCCLTRRRQDLRERDAQCALIAELYTSKITFGQFNVGANRILGQLSEASMALDWQIRAAAPAANKTAERSHDRDGANTANSHNQVGSRWSSETASTQICRS